MKYLIYTFVILFLANCKSSLPNNFNAKKTLSIDTVSIAELPIEKVDTITKVSKFFLLNDLWCYWKHSFTIYDNYGGAIEILMQLKERDSDKIMLEYEYQPRYPEDYDYKSEHYFDTINKRHFTDMNFDGFKDFEIYESGSMPMTSATVIYIFNKETKIFEISELSDTTIEERDSINKILTTSSWNMEANFTKKHHFDLKGNIKFTEVFTEIYDEQEEIIDSVSFKKVHYQKIVNDEIVEEHIDKVKVD